VENVEDNRRAYRELLFSCGKDLAEHISGVILFHETLYQKASSGQMMVELLKSNGIIPGIKVDTGTVPLSGTDGECTTQGLSMLKRFLTYFLHLFTYLLQRANRDVTEFMKIRICRMRILMYKSVRMRIRMRILKKTKIRHD